MRTRTKGAGSHAARAHSFDASNRECALIALNEPEKYGCLQEWAKMVLSGPAPARTVGADPLQPPASHKERKASPLQPTLGFESTDRARQAD